MWVTPQRHLKNDAVRENLPAAGVIDHQDLADGRDEWAGTEVGAHALGKRTTKSMKFFAKNIKKYQRSGITPNLSSKHMST